MRVGGASFVVDPAAGPYCTVDHALAAARASSAPAKTIVLQPGTHYLNATIALGAADSGLTITAAPGSPPGSVVVSGGVLLKPTWTRSSRGEGKNVRA